MTTWIDTEKYLTKSNTLLSLKKKKNSENCRTSSIWWRPGMKNLQLILHHHPLNGHEFQQTPGDSGGQRSLASYSPWGRRVGHDLATEKYHT